MKPPEPGPATVPALILVLLVADSLHFVFARLLRPYLAPANGALFVLAVGTAEVALFMGLTGRWRWTILRRHLGFFLLVGGLVAGATSLTFASVRFIDPGSAALLAQTSTVFALLLSVFWLRESLNRVEAVGAVIAVVGALTIGFQPGDYLRLGALLALAAALLYALHAAVVKRHGESMDFANFFLFRLDSTTTFLLVIAGGTGQLDWPPLQAWTTVVLAGTVDVVLSRVLYYLALRRLRLGFHAILLTLSPALTVVWSLFLFAERPTWTGLAGGLAVIGGVAIVTRGRRRGQRRPQRAPTPS